MTRRTAPQPQPSAAPQEHKGIARSPTTSTSATLDSGDGNDHAFRQLLYDISTAAAHLESARAYLASRMGVSSPQYNMLMVIAQHGSGAGISVNGIAEHLHVSNTFVTMEIKKLERLGLVAKTPNPADARSVLVQLSAQGQQSVQSVQSDVLFVNDHLFEHISAEDFQTLSRIIASLLGDFARTASLLQAIAQMDKEEGTAERVARAIRRAAVR